MSQRKVVYFADEATRKAAQDAIVVQDAVNGMAIVNALQSHLKAMRKTSKVETDDEGEHGLDGDTTNQHPVMTMFVDKLASLAGVQSLGDSKFSEAYAACQALKDGTDVEYTVRRL